jgi:hypothetical protein
VKKELTKHRLEETDLVEDNRENEELQLPLLVKIFLEREKERRKESACYWEERENTIQLN